MMRVQMQTAEHGVQPEYMALCGQIYECDHRQCGHGAGGGQSGDLSPGVTPGKLVLNRSVNLDSVAPCVIKAATNSSVNVLAYTWDTLSKYFGYI